MRPQEGPGSAKGYYLQRPESSLRAHGGRKEENYPQGDEEENKNEGGRTRMLPLSEEEFREQRKARTTWSIYLAIVQRERREGEWGTHDLPGKGVNRKTGVDSRAQSTAPNSQGTRTPSNATPTDSILPKGPATISNQQHKVQSRMKEHRATVRKLGQVHGLHSFHPRPKLA